MEIPVMITITNKEYAKLIKRDIWLECLEQAGVDNWEGIEIALDILNEYNKEQEE